jgi:uncharacterized membrane protein YdbT with pleckstrin-like domain
MRIYPREQVVYETRRHGIVLGGSLTRTLLLVAVGGTLVALDWPWSLGGVFVMAVATLISLRAVVRWDRTKLVLTTERLYVVAGLVGRRSATIGLSSLRVVELEQTLPGRLLGYGTITAGDLEVDFVPAPWELQELMTELIGSRLAA